MSEEAQRKPVKVEVRRQGRPIVNIDSAHIAAGGDDCAAIYIDMRSKYCVTTATGSGSDEIPTVYVEATERSLHLDCTKAPEEWTEIGFPEFNGWQVFCADCTRYTLAITLIRPTP